MHRKLLTSKEAAQYLGISLSFLRKMMMNRIIPMYKPNGKLCYFDPEDLDAFLPVSVLLLRMKLGSALTNIYASPATMSKGVNIYEIMQRFWRENEYEPFSAAEIALYFFLIDRANSRRWQMPFKCPTSVISTAIQVTRQTVVNAREALSERNLITYSKGTGKGSHPMYSLVLTDGLTECLSDKLTETLQDGSTVGLTENMTPYNIEDRNIKDKNYSSNKTGDVRILSLEELEALLVNDEPWLREIISLLSPSRQIELPELKADLCNFFSYLRCQGTKGREENDCRRYFVNWIKKQTINTTKTTLKPTTYATNQPANDARRPAGVSAKSATDYEGAF